MTEPDAFQAAGAAGVLVGFGRTLRAQGLAVGTDRVVAFCRAAAALAPLERDGLYWAGRATLVARSEDLRAFDEAFAAWFGQVESGGAADESEPPGVPAGRSAPPAGAERATSFDAADDPEGEASLALVASAAELLRTTTFEALDDEERRLAHLLVRELEVLLPLRSSRRMRPSRGGRTVDLRRTLRAALRTSGEPFERSWRERGVRVRPLVLVLDISGSMSAYSRALLQFGFAARRAGQKVEVFCFGTRLTRVTRALAHHDPDRALEEAALTVVDWNGGTRIGASLKELLDRYGRHASLRGAVVVLCSDGFDRGDPDVLAAQMARLGRLAHRVVWVNPLKGSPRYQPLARGMAAALPHVDTFLPGHNVESLESLGQSLR